MNAECKSICLFYYFFVVVAVAVDAVAGTDRIPVDRRHYDSTSRRRLDSSFSAPRRRLLPDPWRPLDFLGGGNEGTLECRS